MPSVDQQQGEILRLPSFTLNLKRRYL